MEKCGVGILGGLKFDNETALTVTKPCGSHIFTRVTTGKFEAKSLKENKNAADF